MRHRRRAQDHVAGLDVEAAVFEVFEHAPEHHDDRRLQAQCFFDRTFEHVHRANLVNGDFAPIAEDLLLLGENPRAIFRMLVHEHLVPGEEGRAARVMAGEDDGRGVSPRFRRPGLGGRRRT